MVLRIRTGAYFMSIGNYFISSKIKYNTPALSSSLITGAMLRGLEKMLNIMEHVLAPKSPRSE